MFSSTVVFLCTLTVVLTLTPKEEECVPPLSAKLEAETDEVLKTAIGTALAKYTEGDVDSTKALMAGLSEERTARFRDYYLVDECAMFREFFGF